MITSLIWLLRRPTRVSPCSLARLPVRPRREYRSRDAPSVLIIGLFDREQYGSAGLRQVRVPERPHERRPRGRACARRRRPSATCFEGRRTTRDMIEHLIALAPIASHPCCRPDLVRAPRFNGALSLTAAHSL